MAFLDAGLVLIYTHGVLVSGCAALGRAAYHKSCSACFIL